MTLAVFLSIMNMLFIGFRLKDKQAKIRTLTWKKTICLISSTIHGVMSTGWFEDKTALLFFTLYIFLWNFSPKPRPREKEPSQPWPTKLGSPFIARVEFPGESLRQVLIYLPNCAVAMRKKSELRQHREHGRKQPKPIKIHQMGFKAYHFVFQCTIRSKSAEIPNVQNFLNCGGFRMID